MSAAEAQLKPLMLAALAGDKPAYRALLTALGEQLRRYYRRRLPPSDANVEDLVQETLIGIHSKRETFDTAQPFTPWLYAIARYKLMDHLRRGRIRMTIPLDDAGDIFEPEDGEAASNARLDLDALLANLPPATQEIIRRVKLDGCSTADVATVTGRSEVAVRVSLHRGLKVLSERIREGQNRADR
ncbi:MAG: sigma-70 family RNA polymerase sigma factor [Rhizomicrobium sp.]